jgi:hypothetical protein
MLRQFAALAHRIGHFLSRPIRFVGAGGEGHTGSSATGFHTTNHTTNDSDEIHHFRSAVSKRLNSSAIRVPG